MRDADVPLPSGEVVTLKFDGREVVVWWGPDSNDVDRVAVHGGRVLTWPTVDACIDDVQQAGWVGLGAHSGDDSIGQTTVLVEPVQAWLRGQGLRLDHASALDAWNFAGDIAVSINAPWNDRGRLADRCNDKLFAAWWSRFRGPTIYDPRWSAAELRCLRRVLSDAIHLLRTALT